jgi:hypothetical protein
VSKGFHQYAYWYGGGFEREIKVKSSPSDICTFGQSVLAEKLGQLVQQLLDCAYPPVFLPPPSGHDLGRIYEDCRQSIEVALDAEPSDARRAMCEALPWHLQDGDLAQGILEVITQGPCMAIPESLLSPPATDSRVLSALPSLKERLDDDGLLDCADLAADDWSIRLADKSLHYHQLLRKHFNSNVNYQLIEELRRVGSRPGNRVRFAIDERRLAPAGSLFRVIEKEYWYGPPLSVAWLDDPRKVGRAVHAVADPSKVFGAYWKVFAVWYIDSDGRKVVQMEELVGDSAPRYGPYRLLRYLHSIRDMAAGRFVHCDGAVRAYDGAAYASRAMEEMPPETRATHYRKVFRVDGVIETDEWSRIVAFWYGHNRLATEYLSRLGALV